MAKRKKLDEMTLAELHEEATAQGVEGRSAMGKDELLRALKKGDAGDPASGRADSTNATVGGAVPQQTDEPASVEGGTPTGAAHYPPSPSDSAGEKTDNIPPSKRLPPDVPASEGGPAAELTRLKAEHQALARVVTNLGGNPAEVCKQVSADLAKADAKAAGPVKTATVNGMVVAYPADAKDKDAAARAAYREKAGIWHTPTEPTVEHHK